jgi:hypothetical protein
LTPIVLKSKETAVAVTPKGVFLKETSQSVSNIYVDIEALSNGWSRTMKR